MPSFGPVGFAGHLRGAVPAAGAHNFDSVSATLLSNQRIRGWYPLLTASKAPLHAADPPARSSSLSPHRVPYRHVAGRRIDLHAAVDHELPPTSTFIFQSFRHTTSVSSPRRHWGSPPTPGPEASACSAPSRPWLAALVTGRRASAACSSGAIQQRANCVHSSFASAER